MNKRQPIPAGRASDNESSGDRSALVVGGTGPTGPAVVEGLRQRGFVITLFHSGAHELDEQQDLEHLHGDAFSRESLDEHLGSRSFDLVVAMYGRTRVVADAVAGRCEQFIAVGGVPVYEGYFITEDAAGIPPMPVRENAPLVSTHPSSAPYPLHSIRKTEDAVMAHHERGSFSATILRYPSIYGPRVVHNWEWLVIRRILDKRESMYLPDGGLSLQSRLAWENASAAVLAVIDGPRAAAGQAYNVADTDQFALGEWVRQIAGLMHAELEIRSVPGAIPSPGWALFAFGAPALSPHFLLDTTKIRTQLGYEDVIRPTEALARTIEWATEHAEVVDRTMGIFFDYEHEDAFGECYDRAAAILDRAGQPFAQVPIPPQ